MPPRVRSRVSTRLSPGAQLGEGGESAEDALAGGLCFLTRQPGMELW
jgi:hypothetical protein